MRRRGLTLVFDGLEDRKLLSSLLGKLTTIRYSDPTAPPIPDPGPYPGENPPLDDNTPVPGGPIGPAHRFH